MAIFLWLVVLAVAAFIGRWLLELLRTVPDDRLGRLAASMAIGLGVIAYLVLGVGLVGQVRPTPVLVAIGVVLLVCYRGSFLLGRDFRRGRREDPTTNEEAENVSPATQARSWSDLVCIIAVIALGLIAFVNCFVPPASHEWDALSYHLAAPKVYIQHHQIVFLPTDHHSNFPFLVQMLFTLGLLLQGYALANLFHFTMAALTVLAMVWIGRRYFDARSGWLAALIFASTPIVLWEAGAAYIEHGMALYVLLAAGAALEYRSFGERKWLLLAGVFMGFALSAKTLALIPAVALPCLLVGGRAVTATRLGLKDLRVYAAALVLVGCPFYIKTWVMTGDPVYPFGYRIFGGKYWSQELADAYSGTQTAFGLRASMLSADDDARGIQPGSAKPGIADRLRNMLIAPFALISVPRVFYDYQDPGLRSHLGFLFLSLPPLLIAIGRRQRISGVAVGIGLFALFWYLVWSQTMQYVRYLLPLLPFLGLLGAEGAAKASRSSRLIAGASVIAISIQVFLTLRFFGLSFPERWKLATDPAAQKAYVERTVNNYRSVEWINEHAPADAGVVLFEESRGFYLDRPYLWGNYYHSRYIPYDTLRTAGDMVRWFKGHGIRYGLVNLQFSPAANSSPENLARLREAVGMNSEAALMLEWYGPDATGGEVWRRLLGDAIRSGEVVVIDEASQHGVVVFEFRDLGPAR